MMAASLGIADTWGWTGRGQGRAGGFAARAGMRGRRGAVACLAGSLAEDAAAARYEATGHTILARRWRGAAGEVDLICRKGDCVVFVEVKAGADHARAAGRLGRRQMDRICLAANEYCGALPGGLLTEMRFDAALVDWTGRVEVIENAFADA